MKDTVAKQLEQALDALEPSLLQLTNESINHAGYYPGKESHFKLLIVSDIFDGKSRIARHQMVYRCVHDLLSAGGGNIHALAIHAYTQQQWSNHSHAPDSPKCAGQNH